MRNRAVGAPAGGGDGRAERSVKASKYAAHANPGVPTRTSAASTRDDIFASDSPVEKEQAKKVKDVEEEHVHDRLSEPLAWVLFAGRRRRKCDGRDHDGEQEELRHRTTL